ncbi:MAG: hypothetical protein LBS19_11945 [Clostridiales bacterium]|jgi:hypothetical protein|nr:hypothetical protein [Clostridiales bacterium]
MTNITRVKSINANRTAVAITAALMIAAFLIGGVKSLRGLRADSEAVFSEGTSDSGPDAFDLRVDLTEYNGLAANILSVAKRYNLEADPLYDSLAKARQSLSGELPKDTHDVQYGLYLSVREASEQLAQRVLAANGLSASDREMLTRNVTDMTSLQTIISRESALYNRSAGEFNETLNIIPASLIKTLGLVKPLPLFNN